MHRFPGGNDHGPEHIKRVLGYLDQLLGGKRELLNELELFLLLCSVLLHDQGMLQGRSGHARVSQRLLKLPEFSAYFDDPERLFIGKFVAVHSASQSIEQEFRKLRPRERMGGDEVRPQYLAALLRLADELDEDFRRAKKRIFDKILLPEDSLIYWLINLSIQSVAAVPEASEIEVLVNYDPSELDALYPMPGGTRVNALAGVFRKMQKLNRERQYCMRFMEDGLVYKRVNLRFRDLDDQNDPLVVVLDEANDGENDFRSRADLFREETAPKVTAVVVGAVASPAVIVPPPTTTPTTRRRGVGRMPTGPAVIVPPPTTTPTPPLPEVRLWETLTGEERQGVDANKKAFAEDALEITGQPELYGNWELLVEGASQDGRVTLQTELLIGHVATRPVTVQVFPVGRYPLTPPEVQAAPGDLGEAGPELPERLKAICPPPVWQERYRGLKEGRLVHLVDSVVALQSRAGLFRWHATKLDGGAERTWRVSGASGDPPRLVRSFEAGGQPYEVVIEPRRGYPGQPPSVRLRRAHRRRSGSVRGAELGELRRLGRPIHYMGEDARPGKPSGRPDPRS